MINCFHQCKTGCLQRDGALSHPLNSEIPNISKDIVDWKAKRRVEDVASSIHECQGQRWASSSSYTYHARSSWIAIGVFWILIHADNITSRLASCLAIATGFCKLIFFISTSHHDITDSIRIDKYLLYSWHPIRSRKAMDVTGKDPRRQVWLDSTVRRWNLKAKVRLTLCLEILLTLFLH